MSSSALLGPMRRGRRWVPPAPGTMPRPTSERASSAWSAAMRKSQAKDILNPPPSARPLMAPMVGICSLARRSAKEFRVRLCAHLSSASISRRSFGPAPEQNAFSQRRSIEGSHVPGALYLFERAFELLDDPGAKAFERSGRLSVTVATRFCTETSICSKLSNTSLLSRLADQEPVRNSPSTRTAAQTDQIFSAEPLNLTPREVVRCVCRR